MALFHTRVSIKFFFMFESWAFSFQLRKIDVRTKNFYNETKVERYYYSARVLQRN